MANEELLQEEETSILTLTDENGEDVNFEYLDCIEYNGVEYLVLMPEESNEIVILEVQPVDEENENYVAVESEDILDAVYEIFKQRYKDILDFEDCVKNRSAPFVRTAQMGQFHSPLPVFSLLQENAVYATINNHHRRCLSWKSDSPRLKMRKPYSKSTDFM